jgi:hypothetical protein
MSIKLKVLGGTVIVLLAGMLLLLRQLAQSHHENLRTIGLETLATGRSSFHQLVDNDARMLAASRPIRDWSRPTRRRTALGFWS